MLDEIKIALAGNPNSGKTTIFNNLTGARQKVGNYPGVTVERKEGILELEGERLRIIDLPGTYSLTAYSLEELIARQVLIEEKPQIVVNIVDASNLERNLYLTLQLLELGMPVVVVLNMMDIVRKRGYHLSPQVLSKELGVPVVSSVGHRKEGMDDLLQTIKGVLKGEIKAYGLKRRFPAPIEEVIERLQGTLAGRPLPAEPRWLAIKALEGDVEVLRLLREKAGLNGELENILHEAIKILEEKCGADPESLLADARYQAISDLVSRSLKRPKTETVSLSDKIDQVLCHRFWGLPIFLAFMWFMFQAVFSWSAPFTEALEGFFSWLGSWVEASLPSGHLRSLLVDGIIGGVGGVLVFLPQIIILFLFIALFEDTGYMARAAFIMDRALSPLGLHGKSFVPLLSAFGCNIPGIMAARTLENQRLRLLTILAAPFMSCTARLPIYILFIAAFIPQREFLGGLVNLQGLVLFGIYLLGILAAVITVLIFSRTVLAGEKPPFVMEMPPYRIPTLQTLFLHMWNRAVLYLRKAGTIILTISILMWLLFTFPSNPTLEKNDASLKKEAAQSFLAETGLPPEEVAGLDLSRAENESLARAYSAYQARISEIERQLAAERLEKSYAGRLGQLIEPLIRPLGFDWRVGVALTSAFAAKEVFVATMGQIYSLGEVGEDNPSLIDSIRKDPLFSPLTGVGVMIFSLLMLPCMAALSVIKMETASWKWPLVVVLWNMSLAWLATFFWVRILGPLFYF